MPATRSLSSQSQILKREARRAQRAGFNRVGEQLYAQGAQAKLEERAARGSNIRSAEEEVAAERETQRGIAASNAQRASILRQNAPASVQASQPVASSAVEQPAPRTATSRPAAPAPIDYLDTSGSPMVEQTREERDKVRREALQTAYDKLTNPTGAAGSMKEIRDQQAAATPAPAKQTGPTLNELVSGLRESFDRRNAINKAAEVAARPVTIAGVTQPSGYGATATPQEIEAAASQQRVARITNQEPLIPIPDYVPHAPTPVSPKTPAGNPARVTGRLIRDVAKGVGSAAGTAAGAIENAPEIGAELVRRTVSGTVENTKRAGRGISSLSKDALEELKRSRREFSRGLQGQ